MVVEYVARPLAWMVLGIWGGLREWQVVSFAGTTGD